MTSILDSLMDYIGNTPMVRINNLAKSLDCEIVAKCEFLNPGGSVKDRISKRMIMDLYNEGKIGEETTIIEASSGNTAIGVALIGAMLNKRVIITIADKNEGEKFKMIKALGAEIVETLNDVPHDSPYSNISVAKKLHKEIKDSVLLNQYENPLNPLVHYEETAEEIISQCDGKIDMLVMAAGTGGTVSGVAKKIKERIPSCRIVGVDPEGSLMANDEDPVGPYVIEGIGYDFLPDVFSREGVDEWYKSNDKDSFLMARRLICEEGILCGGSSGAVMDCALKVAKELKEGQRCVVILPDSVRNYMSKFVDEEWMIKNGFMDGEFPQDGESLDSLSIGAMIKNNILVDPSASCDTVYRLLVHHNFNHAAVKDSNGDYKVVSKSVLREHKKSKKPAVLFAKKAKQALLSDRVSKLVRKFGDESDCVVVLHERNVQLSESAVKEHTFVGVLEKCDVWKAMDCVRSK